MSPRIRARRTGVAAIAAVLLLSAAAARAEEGGGSGSDEPALRIEPAPRRRDASWRQIFAGPFQSSRLFAMPTADVVGAYQISLSGDASLLARENTLSTTSVVALGFGDIAQLEYRNGAALTTVDDRPFALPTVGVQLKAPLPPRRGLPALAVALRFGLSREESDGALRHVERATDLYLVARLPLWGRARGVAFNAGLRASQAEIESIGAGAPEPVDRVLWLPTGGIELQVTEQTWVVGELALVPRFRPGAADRPSDVDSGMFGRAGVRWRLLPSVIFDASVGYRIEVERLSGPSGSMANALVDWDMRLGGELFVPWGAIACRTTGIFCE